jgi:hypothetical protein
MAKHSIPYKHSRIKCSRSRSTRKDKTQYGGFVSIAKSWTELSIPSLVTIFGIVKEGLDAASLLLLYIFRILSLKRSTHDFLKSSNDPLVEELTGLKGVNSSVISKFLNNERFLLKPLQEAVVSRIASILVKSHSEGILVFDNTIISKTGKSHQRARKLKDSATGQYVIGYDIVSAHFRYNGISFPLLFEFALGKEYATRVEIACGLLKRLHKLGFRNMYVVFDSAYFAEEFTDLLDELGYTWVTKSKTNRIFEDEYAIPTPIRDISRTIDPKEYHQHKKYPNLWYTTKTLYLNSGYMVRVVFIQNIDPQEGEDSEYFLVSNWINMHGSNLINLYKKRWCIETFYRDSKQNLVLGKYHGTSLRGIINHTALVFMAYLLISYIKGCYISLSEVTTGEFIQDILLCVCKVTSKGGYFSVVFPNDYRFPNLPRMFST